MELSELYNMAYDMLKEKKSNGFGFDINHNSTVTIIVTDTGKIYKATNGTKIENGKSNITCSEFEAISSMLKDKNSKIDLLITLNVENGDFIMPCESCIDMIYSINKENLDCNIMIDINESIKLNTLIDNPSKEEETPKDIIQSSNDITSDTMEDWTTGWDDIIENSLDTEVVDEDYNIVDDNNPIPNQSIPKGSNSPSGYYQSRYVNNTPTPVDASISVTPLNSENSNNISDNMRKNGLSDTDKKDFNKQRLFNAFTNDNITLPNNNPNSTITEKQSLSKKEMIKMAKEKKKMAKKDAKILETSQKKNQ